VLGLVVLVLWLRGGAWQGRIVAGILATCWPFVAWAYLLARYDTINWAASYFAAGYGVFRPRAAASAEIPQVTLEEPALNLDDPFSDRQGRSNTHGSALQMRRELFFYNTRIIEFACERCDGDGQQLVGGGFRICRCYCSLSHGNRLVRASGHRGGRRSDYALVASTQPVVLPYRSE
jgi:hypothetical protein